MFLLKNKLSSPKTIQAQMRVRFSIFTDDTQRNSAQGYW